MVVLAFIRVLQATDLPDMVLVRKYRTVESLCRGIVKMVEAYFCCFKGSDSSTALAADPDRGCWHPPKSSTSSLRMVGNGQKLRGTSREVGRKKQSRGETKQKCNIVWFVLGMSILGTTHKTGGKPNPDHLNNRFLKVATEHKHHVTRYCG